MFFHGTKRDVYGFDCFRNLFTDNRNPIVKAKKNQKFKAILSHVNAGILFMAVVGAG